MNPHVTELALYDIGGTPGVAADVSHVNTGAQCKVGTEQFCVFHPYIPRPVMTAVTHVTVLCLSPVVQLMSLFLLATPR